MLREWSHPYVRIADIGAHHGRLARALVEDGHDVVATELSSGGFQELAEHLAGTRVAVRQGDGLEPLLDSPLDLVVISGMGSDTILEILANRHRMTSRPHFALQPVQGLFALHRAIAVQGWRILKADLVKYRRRYYPLWLVDAYEERPQALPEDALFLPQEFRSSAHYGDWLKDETARRQVQWPTERSQQEMAWLNSELRHLEP